MPRGVLRALVQHVPVRPGAQRPRPYHLMQPVQPARARRMPSAPHAPAARPVDRKSTRLNSSHLVISYAVFCLKKKNKLAAHHQRFLTLLDSLVAAAPEAALSRIDV